MSQITIEHPIPIQPLAWDGKTLQGDVDILIHQIDDANARNNSSLVYRLKAAEATCCWFRGDWFNRRLVIRSERRYQGAANENAL